MPYSRKNTYISIKKVARIFIENCFGQEPISDPVLEVGSGRDKFNRNLFAGRYKFVATNIYPQNVVDHICSVICLPFRNNSFGCVICEHVLEHVDNPSKAIDEISRVLKPNGLLILVVPFFWPIHKKPYDLWRFSEEGVRALLANKFQDAHFEFIGKEDNPRLICVTARKPERVKKKKYPKVSVIIPTYNRAHMVTRAIASVLQQTYQDWELLVVSDGSTDNTKEVVARYPDPRIRFFEKKNGGPASARNVGLRHARGEYIAYCDDDDVMFPYRLEMLVHYLDRHPEIGLIRAFVVYVDQRSPGKLEHLRQGFLWATLHRYRYLKKKIFFDEKQLSEEDIDFILRFSDYYPIRVINAVVSAIVMHNTNYTSLHQDYIDKYSDRLYSKRIRKACKIQHLTKRQFLMLAYFLLQLQRKKPLLDLAVSFNRRFSSREALYLLAYAYYRTKKFKQEQEVLKKILYLNNNDVTQIIPTVLIREYSFSFLAWIFFLQNAHRKAKEFTAKGLREFPRSTLLKLESFHAALEMKERRRVSAYLRQECNRELRVYFQAVYELSRFKLREAEKLFRSIKSHNKIFLYRLKLSLSHLADLKGDKKKARLLFNQAIAVSNYLFAYPFLMRKNLSEVTIKESQTLLNSIFLMDGSHDRPIYSY